MINKDILIQEIIKFMNTKLVDLSKDNTLVSVFVRPIVSRMINNNIPKIEKALSYIADENDMVDADGILNDMIDNLLISPVKEERGIKIGEGYVEINVPFVNKAIHFDKTDIDEFKQSLIKNK